MKQKALTITLLVIMATAFLFISNSQVMAQSPGLFISQVTQQGSSNAVASVQVGEALTLYGFLDTNNGPYKVFLENTLVASGTAHGYAVTANFTVPEMPAGDYSFNLMDINENVNATYPFSLVLTYAINPIIPTSPAQLQEGNTVVLNVTVTGGLPNFAYGANITVQLPFELGTNYSKVVSLATSALGTAQVQVPYPDPSYSPSDSSTLYAGTYTVYLNESQQLTRNIFTVGFTDQTAYHRQDIVKVSAVGYQPNQICTVAISFNNNIVFSQTVTATAQGAITTTWAVPSNASVGTYLAAINPQTTPSKNIADVQSFVIAGYPITFKTVNLAGEAVPQLAVEAIDQGTGSVYSQETDVNGVATINLEKGSATVSVYWNEVKVGETQVTVVGNSSHTVTCQLTDLKIKVQDKNGAVVPFVNLNLTFQYVIRTGSTQTGNLSGQTDVSGVFSFDSVLPGISYSVAASKYDTVFNAGNSTINNVPAQPSYSSTVVCPDETLTLNTVDYHSAALPNARITLIEQASGIFYSATTNSDGVAQIQVTFGQYRAKVYTEDSILLNETVINVLSNTQSTIQCVEYNLQVSVKVVDYFGSPINNVNVQLNRPGMATKSGTTEGNGIATFPNVLGGNMEITAYPAGNQNSYVAANLEVDSPKTVTISMNKYVVFGGLLMEASVLATVLLIILAVVLLAILEVYRRTGFKLPRNR